MGPPYKAQSEVLTKATKPKQFSWNLRVNKIEAAVRITGLIKKSNRIVKKSLGRRGDTTPLTEPKLQKATVQRGADGAVPPSIVIDRHNCVTVCDWMVKVVDCCVGMGGIGCKMVPQWNHYCCYRSGLRNHNTFHALVFVMYFKIHSDSGQLSCREYKVSVWHSPHTNLFYIKVKMTMATSP